HDGTIPRLRSTRSPHSARHDAPHLEDHEATRVVEAELDVLRTPRDVFQRARERCDLRELGGAQARAPEKLGRERDLDRADALRGELDLPRGAAGLGGDEL